MSGSVIGHTPSAYDYPLPIKHLLHAPLALASEQEIVYRGLTRSSYRALRERIGAARSSQSELPREDQRWHVGQETPAPEARLGDTHAREGRRSIASR